MRYKIINTSTSGHCCFTHTVVDTTKPEGYSDEYGEHYEAMCECFNLEDAETITKALNKV